MLIAKVFIHIDAHCDTAGEYEHAKFQHGSPFRWTVLDGVMDPEKTIQIGIRGARSDADYNDFSHESGMRVIYIEEFYDMGVPAVIAEARRVVGDGPVYISFDVDGLDPVYAPGTGTPEVGGYSTHEAQRMVRGLQGLDIVGGDVVCMMPTRDNPNMITARTAAAVMFEMISLIADRHRS